MEHIMYIEQGHPKKHPPEPALSRSIPGPFAIASGHGNALDCDS
jgi:hypothetical protein